MQEPSRPSGPHSPSQSSSCSALFARSRRVLLAAALGITACGSALAQDFPNRVVSFKSAMAAGSTTDVLAREVAKSLQERLKQPVIVDVVTGSGGLIAAQRVVNSTADGYTLLFSSNSLISGQAMRKQSQVDVRKDLQVVSPIVEGNFGLYVTSDMPARTIQEFIAYAKANPGKVNYASSGIGSIVHLVTEDFRIRANLDLVHVPYKGIAETIPELLANRVQAVFSDTTIMQPHIDSGKMRLLAVGAKARLKGMPNVPTFEESGMAGFTPTFWIGLYAPRGTPPAAMDRLNTEVKAILTQPAMQQQFADRGYHTIWMATADGQQKVADELSALNRTIDVSKIERQ